MRRVYVSGPITYATGPDRFGPIKRRLEALGYKVLNPKDVAACETGDCPKLPHEVEKGWPHSWACYLKHDLVAMLSSCDTILMMDGWQDSHGARLELATAAATGMNIWFERDLPPDTEDMCGRCYRVRREHRPGYSAHHCTFVDMRGRALEDGRQPWSTALGNGGDR